MTFSGPYGGKRKVSQHKDESYLWSLGFKRKGQGNGKAAPNNLL